MSGDFIALRVNGEEMTLHDVVSAAKVYADSDFLDPAVTRLLVRSAAARMGIDVSDEELQQQADEFRAGRELYSAQSTLDWLAAHHLQQEDWEYLMEDVVLQRKVWQAVTAGKVDQHFAENKRNFDSANIVQIFIPQEDVARELRAQCMDDNVPFYELARRFAATRYVGRFRRNQMEKMVAAAIFGVQPNEVAGPVKTERGWCLAFVEAFHPATLDAPTRSAIESTLFEEWLEEERRKAKVEKPLLTEV